MAPEQHGRLTINNSMETPNRSPLVQETKIPGDPADRQQKCVLPKETTLLYVYYGRQGNHGTQLTLSGYENKYTAQDQATGFFSKP